MSKTTTVPPPFPDHSAELAALVGSSTGPASLAPNAVNQAMIDHWVEAMGDFDPIYVSEQVAHDVGLAGIIAPPTMLQAWTMGGLRETLAREEARAHPHPGAAADTSAHDRMMALLDAEGMTSVVATNCDQTYERPLQIGDRLVAASVIESVSATKDTALGTGRFVTTRTDFVVIADDTIGVDPDPESLMASGKPVAMMRFRILKFRPKDVPAADEPRAKRPRPSVTPDIDFWFEGARAHQLLIQRCTSCGMLRHPPLPACPSCRSFEWDTLESSGRGTVFSFVVVHHPQVPAFDYPLAIGLVELEEGTRLVANLGGLDPSTWKVGMEVKAMFVEHDEGLTLPVFHPAPDVGSISDGKA